MKKQFLSLGMAAVMMGSAMPILPVMNAAGYAEDEVKTYGKLQYQIIDGDHIMITGCDKEATEVVIPAEIDGLPVTGITQNAFMNCEALTSVSIPDSVTTIGYFAFADCKALTSVNIPNGVVGIGEGTFDGCTSLASIAIPDSITVIGESAFAGCTALTSVTIPDGITSISMYTFSGCTALKSVTIPKSVALIFEGAFNGCENLTIYGYANSQAQTFAELKNIPFVSLGGETVEKQYEKLTYEITDDGTVKIKRCDDAATEVVIPAELDGLPVTYIGYGAFENCKALTSVTIPDSVDTIGEEAFCNCSALASVNIPNNVRYIGSHAFSCCTSLTKLTIPNAVSSIDLLAFHGCDNLTLYGGAGSKADAVAKKRGIPFVAIGSETKSADFNGDGAVNLKDVVLLRRYIAGGWNVTLDETTADLNGDGAVNLKDVIILRRTIAGGWEAAPIQLKTTALERRADGAYTASAQFEGLSGSLALSKEVASFTAENYDYNGTLKHSAEIEPASEWKTNDLGLTEGYNKIVLRVKTADGQTVEKSLVIFVPQALDYSKQALSDLAGVTNARTLAGYINSEGRTIKENVLFRTAKLSRITDEAMQLLTEKYHVTDIMDFRYDRELNPNTQDKMVPGTEYHNIQMSSTEKIANEIFSKNPDLLAKFQELQRNAGKPGGSQALTFFQAEIGFFDTGRAIEYYESDAAAEKYREVFDLFLNKKEGDAILFHCAGGKDRTGMVSMLMLAALDFDKDIMMQDYMMSNIANAKKIEETKAAAAEYTDDPKLIYDIVYTEAVYEEVMSTIIDDLVRDYGSVKGFLKEKVGLTDDDFAKLKEMYLN